MFHTEEAGQVRGGRLHQPLLLPVGRGGAARLPRAEARGHGRVRATRTFTLRETECLASCGTAPCLQINEDHHENLTSREAVDAVFARLKPAS